MPSGVSCVVPARLGSSRFPGKLLRALAGKPVVAHTLERAAEAGCFAEILCFTDSPEIGGAAAAAGFRFVLTSPAANGTERIASHLEELAHDLVVNLQGDEPAFPPEGLRILCAALREDPGCAHTLVHRQPPSPDELADPNRVKAIVDGAGFIRDFTRGAPAGADLRLQLGAYGYSKDYLRRYRALPPSARETALSHEMLRAPELAPLRAHSCAAGASVDAPADLPRAAAALARILQGAPT